jgi:hypothetical protein
MCQSASAQLVPVPAVAYCPAVDSAGPVTVRIQGPREITRIGVPLPMAVFLENQGESELRGTVQVRVIDHWRIEPAAPVSFVVGAKSRMRAAFMLTVGDGTLNAFYPIHAFVEFELAGKRMRAHPVLVLESRLSNPPSSRPSVEWKPVEVPINSAIGLWRLPLRRSSATIVQEDPPVHAASNPAAGGPVATVVQLDGRVQRGTWREALSVMVGRRPPGFQDKLRAAVVEYPLRLPGAWPIRLRFANALGDPGGVTFRIRVLRFAMSEDPGTLVFSRRCDSPVWREEEVDLSRFAGQAVRLQLEAEAVPGTESTIRAYWGEPVVMVGEPAAPRTFPPASEEGSRALGMVTHQGTAYEIRVWLGRRGLLDATVGLAGGGRKLFFGGFRVQVLGDALEDWRSANQLLEAREEPSPSRYRVRHRFSGWAGRFDVVTEAWVEKGALRTRFVVENATSRPWMSIHLEDVALGRWSERAVRIYAGPGNVMQDPQLFQLKANGHYLATSHVGIDFANGIALIQGVDIPPDHLEIDPEARWYSLHTPHAQTVSLIPGQDVWTAAKAWRELGDPRPASGVPRLAGRFVLDLWGGRYREAAQALGKAFRYGLNDSVVIWHNWQRWGYDCRLPDIYPPNPELGSFEEFLDLAGTCKKNGALFAPHDNYIDFYPDSKDFSYDNIAFTAEGQPQRAWYNQGLDAQSYHPRSDRVLPFIQRNMKLIRDGFAPSAYFIDVWSSEPPYDYYTPEGRFMDRVHTRDVWRQALAWIRDYLDGAPQIAEAGMDQYIGWLDGGTAAQMRAEGGAQKNPVWRIETSDTERIPWFDMAYHDCFALHGAGYANRYAAGQDTRSHGTYSDDYISTEVLTGHPGMVSEPFGRDVVRKYWLLHDLMRSLALQRMEGFRFDGGNLHRQHVQWQNGGEVWVNRGEEIWTINGRVLPQYGFYAHVPTKDGQLEAAIELRDGVIVEWSNSPAFIYANARPVVFDPPSQRGWQGAPAEPDPRPARMNPTGKTIALGLVTTNGAFRLTRNGGGLQLIPLPLSQRFQTRLHRKRLPWRLPELRIAEAVEENGNLRRRTEVRKEGDDLVLDCEPGVFAYLIR